MAQTRITISLDAPALARGVGFFETVWVRNRRPIFFRAHWTRLVESCRRLEVPVPEEERAERSIRRAARKTLADGEAGMRWSYLALESDLDDPRSWKFFVSVFPLPPEVVRKRRGVRAVTLPWTVQRSTPRWKTVDYRASVEGLRLARTKKAQEGIFVDRAGRMLEGTASNVFRVAGARIATPPESAGILPGVVRGWVLRQAAQAGLSAGEKAFRVDDFASGFITASLTGLAPLVSVDGRRCKPPGPGFEKLRRIYLEAARSGEEE
jgi:branched-subunit amino acid aminotransferase/4-amino-4-deoxychorismate lyase